MDTEKQVTYTMGEEGDIMRHGPNGRVLFHSSLWEASSEAFEFQRQGYEVFFEGKPLVPTNGFFGFLHRMLDRAEPFVKSIIKWMKK